MVAIRVVLMGNTWITRVSIVLISRNICSNIPVGCIIGIIRGFTIWDFLGGRPVSTMLDCPFSPKWDQPVYNSGILGNIDTTDPKKKIKIEKVSRKIIYRWSTREISTKWNIYPFSGRMCWGRYLLTLNRYEIETKNLVFRQ